MVTMMSTLYLIVLFTLGHGLEHSKFKNNHFRNSDFNSHVIRVTFGYKCIICMTRDHDDQTVILVASLPVYFRLFHRNRNVPDLVRWWRRAQLFRTPQEMIISGKCQNIQNALLKNSTAFFSILNVSNRFKTNQSHSVRIQFSREA